MVRGWFAIRVELESGRGIVLNPSPGRIMLIGPQHTFKDLAEAIDAAFARWDLAHLHEFEFSDGRRFGIPDEDFGQPITHYEQVRVSETVHKGETFAYVFDLGDYWQHRCRVEETELDPVEVAGIVPDRPIPIWGWGWIPDQYGRRWDGDTDEDDAVAYIPPWQKSNESSAADRVGTESGSGRRRPGHRQPRPR